MRPHSVLSCGDSGRARESGLAQRRASTDKELTGRTWRCPHNHPTQESASRCADAMEDRIKRLGWDKATRAGPSSGVEQAGYESGILKSGPPSGTTNGAWPGCTVCRPDPKRPGKRCDRSSRWPLRRTEDRVHATTARHRPSPPPARAWSNGWPGPLCPRAVSMTGPERADVHDRGHVIGVAHRRHPRPGRGCVEPACRVQGPATARSSATARSRWSRVTMGHIGGTPYPRRSGGERTPRSTSSA